MIAASEPQEFIPLGRQKIGNHPGQVVVHTRQPGTSLLQRLSRVQINENNEDDRWILRRSKEAEEEELYVKGKTAIWSKGMSGRSIGNNSEECLGSRLVQKCYTMESEIKLALFCNFVNWDKAKEISLPSICLIDNEKISAFTIDGDDFLSPLQFKISSAWSTKFGLLIERVTAVSLKKKVNPNVQSTELPILFSLVHPLDEVSPVLMMKPPGDSLSFITDPYIKLVFTSEEPSLLVYYDMKSGQHSVWKVRRATSEESRLMCGEQDCTITSQSSHSFQSIVNNSNSTNNFTPRVSLQKRASLPAHFRTPITTTANASLSNSNIHTSPTGHSPMNSYKTNNITPNHTFYHSSPGGSVGRSKRCTFTSPALDARLGNSVQSCLDFNNEPKPIVPEICLDYIWSETLSPYSPNEGGACAASRVFLSSDVLDQKFLCYVVPSRSQMTCIRLTWTNQKSPEVILGSVSTIPAKDAAYLPSSQMTAVLEPSGGVLLYTGITLIGKLHVAGVNTAVASSSYLSSASIGFAENSLFPRRSCIMSSTVIGDAAFDDLVHLLSPVTTSIDFLEPSISGLIHSTPRDTHLKQLKDPVSNRVTLEYLNGSMFRISLPELCSSPLVSKCINVLKSVLPRESALLTIVKWCGARNAPGTQDFTPNQEWKLFVSILLGLIGYDVEKLSVLHENTFPFSETQEQILKKKKSGDSGTEDDWDYLLSSNHHSRVNRYLCTKLGLKRAKIYSFLPPACDETEGYINTTAPLFLSIHLILFSFHLLYEDIKLDTLLMDSLPMLAQFLHQLAVDLRLDDYVYYYWTDFPSKCPLMSTVKSQISVEHLKILSVPTFICENPPSVMDFIHYSIRGLQITKYPIIYKLNQRSKDILQLIRLYCCDDESLDQMFMNVVPPGTQTTDLWPRAFPHSIRYNKVEKVVYLLSKMGYTGRDVDTFPIGVMLILYEAIHRVRENPPLDWSEDLLRLVDRGDLLPAQPHPIVEEKECSTPPPSVIKTNPDDDGMDSIDKEVLKLRFSEDHRVNDVRNLLQSSQPVTIAIPQRPDVSDHEFIEEQERHLYAICTRTMALPVGRGMFTLRTSYPVLSEPLPVPRLCLSGKAPPRGTTVDLSHIEVVPNMNLWPLFHNGVAAGLRISTYASNIDSTWIVYNKPKGGPEVLPEHAGFLMALGLNGHLGNLAKLNMFKYLNRCHEMTSVGLILGVSADKRGTMDVSATKMLSIHIESLLPPTSIELDIVQNIQVAALLGIGLVYQETAHRHIAEVLLSEIGRPPGPEMENSIDRESYSLAAGLGLGLVVLGKGPDSTGLADLGIPDTLYYYMVGGQKRPLTGSQKEKYKSPSYQIREGEQVNTAVTAPGATLALGLMFFRSGNKTVANWMEAPDTQYLLDFVCPDLLLLRMIAKGLILWDDIVPTQKWVLDHVPAVIQFYSLRKPRDGNIPDNIDYETMNQAFCNIVAGACMAMGLRFAGSANNEAFNTLFHFCKNFTSMSAKSVSELAGKSTIETCLNVILLSLAMVMAGTGELEILRLCRYLRSRVGQATNSVVTYGSHLAIHMALGLIFLGSGKYSLSTSPAAVAAMLCAFFPKFPTHSNDNRYHLQAFRHLYVLAAEPRLLLPRDIDSKSLCYSHLKLVYLDTPYYKDQFVTLTAPCILPELNLLKEVRVDDPRYWKIVFRRDENWSHLVNLLKGAEGSGCLNVKQRAGCLSYLEDPHGFRSLLAQCLTSDKAVSWSVPAEKIFSFTSYRCIVNFTRFFLEPSDRLALTPSDNELHFTHFLTKLTYECVTHDKTKILSIWLKVIETIQLLQYSPGDISQLLWQLKIIIAHGTSSSYINQETGAELYAPLVYPDLALALQEQINHLFDLHTKQIWNCLYKYMKTGKLEDTSVNINWVALYSVFYNFPTPPKLLDILKDASNPLRLHLKLKNSNLQASTLTKIHSFKEFCRIENSC